MTKKILILTIFTILGMIILPTIYQIYEDNNQNKIIVVEKEFMYNAKSCYNKGDCKRKVTLKDLYDKKYLKDKLTNPLTKKYYNETSYIDLNTSEIKLIS